MQIVRKGKVTLRFIQLIARVRSAEWDWGFYCPISEQELKWCGELVEDGYLISHELDSGRPAFKQVRELSKLPF